MSNINEISKALISAGEADVIIGYEKGSADKVRAAFITSAESCDKLIFDERCNANLAVYLTKKELKKFGKKAIVVRMPGLKSIIALIAEKQLKADEIIAIAAKANDEFSVLKSTDEMLAFIHVPDEKKDINELVEKIEKMSVEERWYYWQDQFSKCFKCYACRAACPLCYCGRCTVDINQPQWISVPSSKTGNLEWHIMRAMHLAGRCINCNACADACPQGIPLQILTQKLSNEIFKEFHYEAGTSAEQRYALSDFNTGDKENFIK
ncbi:MAG: hypothetical protein WCM76_06010 [Bacteroidota bacterium]